LKEDDVSLYEAYAYKIWGVMEDPFLVLDMKDPTI
jgi:hypothetical protein